MFYLRHKKKDLGHKTLKYCLLKDIQILGHYGDKKPFLIKCILLGIRVLHLPDNGRSRKHR